MGPKCLFSVGEWALWARLAGPQFAAQVAAVVSLVEAPANHRVADLEEAKRLAAEFEAMGCGALTMALAQEAEPGDPLRKCWLADERLRVSEARSISRAEILTARTDATAEATEVSAVEAAAAETAVAVDAAAATEAAATAGEAP